MCPSVAEMDAPNSEVKLTSMCPQFVGFPYADPEDLHRRHPRDVTTPSALPGPKLRFKLHKQAFMVFAGRNFQASRISGGASEIGDAKS
jgi:hypothetical protein